MRVKGKRAMTTRNEYKSETKKMTHIRRNTFTYGSAVITKYTGGYCVAKIGSSMTWEADSEAELIEKLDSSGYSN